MPEFSNESFPIDPLPVDDGLVEAYLDDELSADELLAFEARLADEADLAAELALARQVRDGLRELPRLSCPEPVSRAALDHARAHSDSTHADSTHADFGAESLGDRLTARLGTWLATLVQRPAIPALAAIALVIAVSLPLFEGSLREDPLPGRTSDTVRSRVADVVNGGPTPDAPAPLADAGSTNAAGTGDPAYSAAEVERAEREVKLALAYLGRLGSTADRSVRQLTVGKWTARGDDGSQEP